MSASRGWRAAEEGVPGAPRDPLSLLTAPRDLKTRGVHWASRFGDGGPCRGPAPLSYGAGVRVPDSGLQQPKRWHGTEPPTRHLGVPCSRHPEKPSPRPSSGCGPHPQLSAQPPHVQPRGEYGLRGATSQRGQPLPIRPVRSVPSWTSGALGNEGGPRGRPFQAPPCKQTRLRFPLPAPAACKAR